MAHRPKVGDIYALRLHEGKYSFFQILNDGSIRLFRQFSDQSSLDTIRYDDVMFTVGLYADQFKSPDVIYVKKGAFETADSSWPPKKCMYSPEFGHFFIYDKGTATRSTREECIGLELAEVWELGLVKKRALGDESMVKVIM